MDKIIQDLTEITEKYKIQYSNSFDRNGHFDTLQNNVLLVAELQLKLAEEFVNVKKSYCEKHNITDTNEIKKNKNNLYMDFIQFATTFEG